MQASTAAAYLLYLGTAPFILLAGLAWAPPGSTGPRLLAQVAQVANLACPSDLTPALLSAVVAYGAMIICFIGGMQQTVRPLPPADPRCCWPLVPPCPGAVHRLKT